MHFALYIHTTTTNNNNDIDNNNDDNNNDDDNHNNDITASASRRCVRVGPALGGEAAAEARLHEF